VAGRLGGDESFAMFEQLKLSESFANSRFFKKKILAVFGNVLGVDSIIRSVYPSSSSNDVHKVLKFLRKRLMVISRTPQLLPPTNIHLTTPLDPKLCDYIAKTMADLYLSRNVIKGF
jgi:hypothetical protein